MRAALPVALTILPLTCGAVEALDLMAVELREGSVRTLIEADGSCVRNELAGTIPPDVLALEWRHLGYEHRVQELTSPAIARDIREQIRKSGTVVAEDGARTTVLTVRTAKSTTRIEVHGLRMLRATYPDARQLRRFDASVRSVRVLGQACAVE